MAKNLFEQFLSFAASKLAGPVAHENIYREEEPGGLSGVEKYLAKQEAAQKAKEAASMPAAASSVEKYLARQAAALAAKEVSATPETAPEALTGVAKYLAGQGKAPKLAAKESAPAPVPNTRVGRYLAGQSETVKNPAPAPAPAPTTGVGKYLAGSFKADVPKASASASKKPAVKAAAAPAKTQPEDPFHAAPVVQSEAQPVEKPKPPSATLHLDDGKQCQASTTKGTQCKNTTNLSHIQRTINKQKYQFSVCKQHHNEKFKPFAPLLD